MNQDNIDERYTLAEEAIIGSLFQVMKQKPLEKITVSDVIKRAGIVRSTFYNHFENIPDLIQKMEDRTIQDIFQLISHLHTNDDLEVFRSYFLTLCEYTQNNPFLIQLLRSPHGNHFMEKAITMLHNYVSTVMERYEPVTTDKNTFSYLLAGTIGTSIGILHKWTTEDFSIPAETVAAILTHSFVTLLLPSL